MKLFYHKDKAIIIGYIFFRVKAFVFKGPPLTAADLAPTYLNFAQLAKALTKYERLKMKRDICQKLKFK